MGIVAPAGTPRPVIDILHAALVETLKICREHSLDELGVDVATDSPEQFAAYIHSEDSEMGGGDKSVRRSRRVISG